MKGEEENSTFHEAKEYFKMVKGRLGRIIETSIDVTPNLKENHSVPENHNVPEKDIYNQNDLICKLLDHILKTVNLISKKETAKENHFSASLCTMKDIQKKTEILLQTINESLKESNDAVYDVLNRMNSACREIILDNSDLLEIIQKILLKFCEVGDILDFNQSEATINALFDMSKLIYIYKNKLGDIFKEKGIILDREYKMKRFGFYYTEEEESFLMDSLCISGPEIPYTDWSTWIGTFTEPNKDSFEGTPVKKKCVRKRNESIKIRECVNIKEYSNEVITLEALGGREVSFEDLPKDVKKIGEASFSEVFKSGDDVYKIIPLGNDEGKTPLEVFLKEAFIQKILSKEKGVCGLRGVLVAKGAFSTEYLKAWDSFGIEENERPSKYGNEQTYGVLIMEDAGVPLEKYSFGIQKNMVAFIKALVRILSNLETKYEFEHRDLHWGNILIFKSKIKLIDFTLSRFKVDNRVIYNDLSQYPWLFQGDSSVDEQFEIYRKMKISCGDNWMVYNPTSNFYWIEYVVNKCYSKMKRIRDRNMKDRLLGILKESKSIKDLEKRLKEEF